MPPSAPTVPTTRAGTLTFLYLPPPEHEGRAERLLYERSDDTVIEAEPHAQLEWFVTETDRALQMLAGILPRQRRSTMPGRLPICTGPSPPSVSRWRCRQSRPTSMPSCAIRRSSAVSSPSSAISICAC